MAFLNVRECNTIYSKLSEMKHALLISSAVAWRKDEGRKLERINVRRRPAYDHGPCEAKTAPRKISQSYDGNRKLLFWLTKYCTFRAIVTLSEIYSLRIKKPRLLLWGTTSYYSLWFSPYGDSVKQHCNSCIKQFYFHPVYIQIQTLKSINNYMLQKAIRS